MSDIENRVQQIAQVLGQLEDTQVPRNIRNSARDATSANLQSVFGVWSLHPNFCQARCSSKLFQPLTLLTTCSAVP